MCVYNTKIIRLYTQVSINIKTFVVTSFCTYKVFHCFTHTCLVWIMWHTERFESLIQHPPLDLLNQFPTAAEYIKLVYLDRSCGVMLMKYSAIAALLLGLLNGFSLPKPSVAKIWWLTGLVQLSFTCFFVSFQEMTKCSAEGYLTYLTSHVIRIWRCQPQCQAALPRALRRLSSPDRLCFGVWAGSPCIWCPQSEQNKGTL